MCEFIIHKIMYVSFRSLVGFCLFHSRVNAKLEKENRKTNILNNEVRKIARKAKKYL